MEKKNKIVQYLLSVIVLLLTFYFFSNEFRNNWLEIKTYRPDIHLIYIMLSLGCIIACYLLVTYGWFENIRLFTTHKQISFTESLAFVNTTSLAKYIPGKLWSYPIQIAMLGNLGFSKSLVFHVNIIALISLLSSSTLIGMIYITFFSKIIAFNFSLFLLCLIVVFYTIFILFNSFFFTLFTVIVKKMIHMEISTYNIPLNTMLKLQIIYLSANIFFSLSGFFICKGLGYQIDVYNAYNLSSAILISDVIGFAAIVAPGGLGVRESILYLLIKEFSPRPLALILPIILRVVNMLSDIILGLIGFVFLKRYLKNMHRKDDLKLSQ